MSGKTIRLFLVDGMPDGLLTAEIGNWTGLVSKAPRTQLAQLVLRQETGVYMLIGEDPDNPEKQQVYIGESDSVMTRLGQHTKNSDKDFWTDTVVITTKDDNLTKAHVRYLEERFIALTAQSGRATLRNGTNPNGVKLPAPDRSDMDEFVAQLQILLPVLGVHFTIPAPKITPVPTVIGAASPPVTADSTPPVAPTPTVSPIFELKTQKAQGKAQEVNNQFIVAQGAQVEPTETVALGKTYILLRASLRSNGTLEDNPDTGKWVLTADTVFSSPTAAAAVLGGSPVNGRTAWRVENSPQTYADWQDTHAPFALVPDTLDGSVPS